MWRALVQTDETRGDRQTRRGVIELFPGLNPPPSVLHCSFVCHLAMCQFTLVRLLTGDQQRCAGRYGAYDLFPAREELHTKEEIHMLSESAPSTGK